MEIESFHAKKHTRHTALRHGIHVRGHNVYAKRHDDGYDISHR